MLTKEDRHDDLLQKIYDQTWKYAKTYDKKAPHEYILMEWNEELFREIGAWIDEFGEDKPYYKTTVRYGYIGNYRYWHYNTYVHDSVMNRAKEDGYSDEDRAKYMISGFIKGEA